LQLLAFFAIVVAYALTKGGGQWFKDEALFFNVLELKLISKICFIRIKSTFSNFIVCLEKRGARVKSTAKMLNKID